MAVRYIVVPVGPGAPAATGRLTAALARQVDLVNVGIDPAYEVFSNTAWAPLFSVLAGGTVLANAGATPVATAEQLQQLDVHTAQALPLGSSGSASFTVMVHASGQVLYGASPGSAWRITVNGLSVGGQATVGGATAWPLPVGQDSVVLLPVGSAGQHVADVLMALLWTLALLAALARVQMKLGSQLTTVTLGLGAPGEEVSEIRWPTAAEGDEVG
jgi:hypothetical protein